MALCLYGILGGIKCIFLIILIGRYDLHWFSLVCEACNFVQQMSVTSIINEGYWPGCPCQVNYLFDQEVFKVWDIFRTRMPGSSESAFIKALEDISLAGGRVRLKSPVSNVHHNDVFCDTVAHNYIMY